MEFLQGLNIHVALIISIVGALALTWFMNEVCDRSIGAVLDEVSNRSTMSQSVKGTVLSAFASSAPELSNILLAVFVFNSFVDVGLGTIAGSALVNAVLGSGLVLLCCLKKGESVELEKHQVKRDVYSYIILLVIFIGGVYLKVNTRILGAILVACYIYFVHYAFKHDTGEEEEKVETGLETKSKMYLAIDMIIGLALLLISCNFMIIFAQYIGEYFKIPMLIMALIVLALSTSVPDISLSIRDGKNGNLHAGLASCVSSNFFDIAFSIGIALLITGVNVTLDAVASYTMAAVFICMLVVAKFYSGKMTRNTGKIFIAIYIAFIISLFVMFV